MQTQKRASGSRRAGLIGNVASVNVSHGGVPKRPIPGSWVDRLGLEADAHEVRRFARSARSVAAEQKHQRRRPASHCPLSPRTTARSLTWTLKKACSARRRVSSN